MKEENPKLTVSLLPAVSRCFETLYRSKSISDLLAITGIIVLSLLTTGANFERAEAPADPANYVILISIDGLRPDAITSLTSSDLPNFYRLRTEGAITDNARTDFDYTVTLPNHVTQITGRRVTTSDGHNWTNNTDPAPDETIHSNKGSYVAGVFDVAHDNALRTGAYASKSKFVLFDQSYDADAGAPDNTGTDDGRDKIDVYVYDSETTTLVSQFISHMEAEPFHFAFVHLRDPDSAGHSYGWDLTADSQYMQAVRKMDELIGQILSMIDNSTTLSGSTSVFITSDHGGTSYGHGDPTLAENYTIPLYAWGAGIKAGADLYWLNTDTRQDPGTSRPDYDASPQPIRHADAANASLSLLGLTTVPGSTINPTAELKLDDGGTESAPTAPSGLDAVMISDVQIDLSWIDNSNNETGFSIERSPDGLDFAEIQSVASDVRSYSDIGLASLTTYYYRVRAYNEVGYSEYSEVASATTDDGSPASTMHVEAVEIAEQKRPKGHKAGSATVWIVDEQGSPVSSGLVSGSFSGDVNEQVSGTTGADGSVLLVTSDSKRGNITFSFCVENVEHTALTYAPEDNVQTCSGSGAGKSGAAAENAPELVLEIQSYPNPFTGETSILYTLAEDGRVRLAVYDALGRLIRVLVDESQPAGRYGVLFDAAKLTSGTYIYRLQAGSTVQTGAMLLVK